MVGFWSDVRDFAEGLGNSITSPGTRRLPPDFERDTAWVDKLLHEVRLSWYFGEALTSSKVRVDLIVLTSLTMDTLPPVNDLAVTAVAVATTATLMTV
jgi:hypothetical protein